MVIVESELPFAVTGPLPTIVEFVLETVPGSTVTVGAVPPTATPPIVADSVMGVPAVVPTKL